MPFGVQPGHVRLLLRIVEAHEDFDLASRDVRRGIHARHRACEFAIREAVNAEPHALSCGDVADVVGRYQAFETQAGRDR